MRRNPDLIVWRLVGRDEAGNNAVGYTLGEADASYYDVKDAANAWARVHTPQLVWRDAQGLGAGTELPEGTPDASALVPGEVKLASYDWRLTEGGDEGSARYSRPRSLYAPRTLDGHLIGLVVNPKKKKPALVVFDGSHYVRILRMDKEGFPEEGVGYYDTACNDDFSEQGYGWPCETSDCVRAHCPEGVEEKGGGYGTALYTALALGAHQYERTGVRESVSDCISSGDVGGHGRSAEARRWWSDNSPPGRDYAEAETREGEESEEEHTEEGVDATELGERLLGEEYDDGTISYVNRISVDVTKMDYSGGEDGNYNTLKYSTAVNAGLVAAALDVPLKKATAAGLWERISDHFEGRYGEPEIHLDSIVALDVRGLTLDSMNVLGFLAGKGGASDEQLDHLRQRWEQNLDPDEGVSQLRLLPNASRGTAATALDDAHRARERLGWDRWANSQDD